VVKCVSILGGVALLIASGVAGFNGEAHLVAYALIGFGTGMAFESMMLKKAA